MPLKRRGGRAHFLMGGGTIDTSLREGQGHLRTIFKGEVWVHRNIFHRGSGTGVSLAALKGEGVRAHHSMGLGLKLQGYTGDKFN